MHSADVPDENFPALQELQFDDDIAESLPGGQSVHSEAENEFDILPASQSEHVLTPSFEYLPALQSEHVDPEIAPTEAENLPMPQFKHTDADKAAEYFPTSHSEQNDWDTAPRTAEYLPLPQS